VPVVQSAGVRRRGRGLRPTTGRVLQALFSLLGERVRGARVLDLFAGTGALGIEALRRGAEAVDFVEVDSRLVEDLRHRLARLGLLPMARLYAMRAEQALRRLEGRYDLVLLDPPYAYPDLEGFLEALLSSPLVGEESLVVVEHSKHRPLPSTIHAFTLWKRRRYGDTLLSIYARGGAPHGESPVPGDL
jgi:16S rRNA (guanine966-N2)-methyltransferase